MPSLTRDEAARRSALVAVGGYHVDLDLTGDDAVFRSVTTIDFTATRPGDGTFLDVRPEHLHRVRLNGRDLDVSLLHDGRLPLDGLAAANRLEVVADMRYSREGEGLHRYTDPADNRTYLYAFVYVDQAPRVFACFDQPDLKAPYRFTVATPDDWTVLGTSPATQTAPGRWELAVSAPQSTYLTTLVAGPYRSYTAEYDGIPLGVHCRASQAARLAPHAAEIFDVTARCLAEYQRLFGVRYPFETFHQVFVPEFGVLSLDHPGCVLLRELYLDPVTDSERETRAVVLAHGISLMWLAGLVTHRWWDDYWLGQAFADYLAHRVTSEVTRFPGPPVTFSVRRKAQAYVADQRPSTHPVGIEGDDVQSVLLEMDRITYFKGHSVLRQLATRVGEQGLRDGLREYFARHRYGTATYADFLTALAEATGTDLTAWADDWFSCAGVNVLTAELDVADGRIRGAAIVQSAPAGLPRLRSHTIDIGLYGSQPRTERVIVSGERTELPDLVGTAAPEFMLINDGDLTYAKIRLDPQSRGALRSWLPRLPAQNRAMLWCALLLGLQDDDFPAADYLRLVGDMIRREPELSILTEVLEQTRNDVLDRYLAPSLRPAALADLAAALRERLAVTEPGDERAVPLLRALADSETDPTVLRAWLSGTPLPAGLRLDSGLAWRLRYRLVVLGAFTELDIAAAQRAEPGADADQWAAKCRAARPDPAAKAEAWATIMADPTVSNYHLWALAEGFWQPDQAHLTDDYVARFFAEIAWAANGRGDLVTIQLIQFLFPRFAAQPGTVAAARELLNGTDLSVPVRRAVADYTDDLERVERVRRRQLITAG